jgi:hypothetical protein
MGFSGVGEEKEAQVASSVSNQFLMLFMKLDPKSITGLALDAVDSLSDVFHL